MAPCFRSFISPQLILGLAQNIDMLYLPDISGKCSRTVIAQPGLRYAQADALIRSLPLDVASSAIPCRSASP